MPFLWQFAPIDCIRHRAKLLLRIERRIDRQVYDEASTEDPLPLPSLPQNLLTVFCQLRRLGNDARCQPVVHAKSRTLDHLKR